MTRKEALDKIPHVRWYGDDAHGGWLIDTLIALGVLEIEEPKCDPEEDWRWWLLQSTEFKVESIRELRERSKRFG